MSRHIGCYFHYTQSIHRKIQTLGLSTIYRANEEARFICQQLMVLALLPVNKVEPAFQSLADNHPESLDELFEYFESFWMETTSIDLWNVFDLKIRTNNNAEGKTLSFTCIHHTRRSFTQVGTTDSLIPLTKNIPTSGISFVYFKKKKFTSINMSSTCAWG